jgi:hypothetical protein
MNYLMMIFIFHVVHWVWISDLICLFCLFSVFAAMAPKVTNNWKDHGWWIVAEEAEMPMLWITMHAIVEGRHWSALGKVFGQILMITPSGSDSLIFGVSAEGTPLLKVRLQRRLLFAPMPRVCLEAQPPLRRLKPLQDLWMSIPEALRSARETCVQKFLALSPEQVLQAQRLHAQHTAYDDMRTRDQVRAFDQRPTDPEETDPMYRVFAAPITVNWGPEARGGRRYPPLGAAEGDGDLVPHADSVPCRVRSRVDRSTQSASSERTTSGVVATHERSTTEET